MVIYKPVPGQEEVNANYLWRHRAAIIAKSDHRLKTAVQHMISNERFRQYFQRNCLKIATPGSAETASRLILNLLVPVTKHPVYYVVKSRREIRA